METKYVRVPFEVELAKKITNGECDGRIATRNGESVRILCFDRKGTHMPIIALVEIKDGEEDYLSYYENGHYDICDRNSKDLMLEIPEYMTFKDGDVLTYRPSRDRWCIFIYKGNDGGLMHNYVTYDCDSRENNTLTFGKSSYISTLCEPSTESEKQSLIDVLKASKEQKAKEYLKRFFGIEVKQEYEFKPFDKVLVRCYDESQWCARFFDRMFKGTYACTDSLRYKQCIPYNEQTAHLLGTTEKYE